VAKATALGLEQSVRFLGPVFGPAKDAMLRRAGIFALPSFSEGLPMAVLEAWSYGTPVLMTEACNLPEGFAAGAAYRCGAEPQSVAAGLDALTLGADIDRCAMGARGRALVEQKYGWSLVARRMSAVYDWLLGGPMPDTLRNADKR
jgi:poly(glycerol-phosphate) alpha-glucosyltransferase